MGTINLSLENTCEFCFRWTFGVFWLMFRLYYCWVYLIDALSLWLQTQSIMTSFICVCVYLATIWIKCIFMNWNTLTICSTRKFDNANILGKKYVTFKGLFGWIAGEVNDDISLACSNYRFSLPLSTRWTI